MIGTDFYYDGEYSVNHGIYIVRTGNGLIQSPFLAEKEIIYDKIPGNDIPYFYDVEYQPLKFSITFSILDKKWTFEKRREIAGWLDKQQYVEFYSCDNIDKRYYLLYKGGINLQTTANLQGYIECEFENISPYSYSPIYFKQYNIPSLPIIINFENNGDKILKPEITIEKINDGDFSIKNLNNAGKLLEVKNLLNNEAIYINNENQEIVSDITPRYDDFNNNYLELLPGINRLEINGECKLYFRYQFAFKG